MRHVLSSALLAFALAFPLTARSATVVFEAPPHVYPYGSLYWPVLQGFRFDPYWESSNGRDARNAPYIPGRIGRLSSDFGSFTFQSISLGGWPWQDFGIFASRGPVLLSFYSADGAILGIRNIGELPAGNDVVTYSETIHDVSAIAVEAMQASVLAARLDSIEFETSVSSVPEPSIAAFMLVGIGAITRVARAKGRKRVMPA